MRAINSKVDCMISYQLRWTGKPVKAEEIRINSEVVRVSEEDGVLTSFSSHGTAALKVSIQPAFSVTGPEKTRERILKWDKLTMCASGQNPSIRLNGHF